VVDRLIDQVKQLGGEQYRQALEKYGQPPALLDLDELTRTLTRRVEFNTGVRIRLSSEAPGPLHVHAVRSYIEISLENLLVNAVQALRATPPDLPLVTVRMHTAETGARGRGRPVVRSGRGGQRAGADGWGAHRPAGRGRVLPARKRRIRSEVGAADDPGERRTVDILAHSALGGAHLRVWLPRLTASTPHQET